MGFDSLEARRVNLTYGAQQQCSFDNREAANPNHALGLEAAVEKIHVAFCNDFVKIGNVLAQLRRNHTN